MYSKSSEKFRKRIWHFESVLLHGCLGWADGQKAKAALDSFKRKIERTMEKMSYPRVMMRIVVDKILVSLSEEVGKRGCWPCSAATT